MSATKGNFETRSKTSQKSSYHGTLTSKMNSKKKKIFYPFYKFFPLVV